MSSHLLSFNNRLKSRLANKEIRPTYVLGSSLGIGFCGLICFLSLFLHVMLERENNKRRDREYGPVNPDEQFDVTLLGDKHPKFRYFT